MQMKNLKQLSLLSSSLCLVLILFACRKDKVPNLSCGNEVNTDSVTCVDFTYSEPAIIENMTRTDTQYIEPCFSPFTDDEFVYVRRVAGVSAPEIVKYTISSKSEQVLCTSDDTGGFPLGSPDWGKQSKIIFNVGTGSSGIGYIINDNGSGLQQFLPSNVNFSNPKFNGYGNEIIGGGTVLSDYYGPIYNLSADIVDSIPFRLQSNKYGVGAPNWFDGDFIDGLFSYIDFSQSPTEKGLCYIESDTIVNPIISTNTPEGYRVTDIDKYQNLIYYVMYGLGFYQYNETTGVTTLLQEMCDSRKIIKISVSQISGDILIEEENNTKLSESGGVDIQSNIYLLNPYTMEKTPILVE
jgi:hypothetical protein